jgi:hypothetical protein
MIGEDKLYYTLSPKPVADYKVADDRTNCRSQV